MEYVEIGEDYVANLYSLPVNVIRTRSCEITIVVTQMRVETHIYSVTSTLEIVEGDEFVIGYRVLGTTPYVIDTAKLVDDAVTTWVGKTPSGYRMIITVVRDGTSVASTNKTICERQQDKEGLITSKVIILPSSPQNDFESEERSEQERKVESIEKKEFGRATQEAAEESEEEEEEDYMPSFRFTAGGQTFLVQELGDGTEGYGGVARLQSGAGVFMSWMKVGDGQHNVIVVLDSEKKFRFVKLGKQGNELFAVLSAKFESKGCYIDMIPKNKKGVRVTVNLSKLAPLVSDEAFDVLTASLSPEASGPIFVWDIKETKDLTGDY